MFQLSRSLFSTKLLLSFLLITLSIVDSRLHQSKDSLRDALDVLARKQRSLDASSQQSQNYYNPLRTIKFTDEQIMNDNDDDDDDVDNDNNDGEDDEEDLESISMNNSNQLDHINSNDFGRINDMRQFMELLRDLKSHIKTEKQQRDNEQSLFRERERIGNHKRDAEHMNSENYDREEWIRLFLDTLRNSPSYNNENIDDINEYPGVGVIPTNDLSIEMFRPQIYDNYRNNPRNNIDIDDDRQFLDELLPSVNRQITLEHYPISREYKYDIKRFPVAKRSGNTKKLNDIKPQENTDPKVAQDLKSLFGTHSMSEENLTDSPNNRNHNNHKIQHNNERTNVEKNTHIKSTTNIPITGTTTANNGGQNEIVSTIVASSNKPDDKVMVKKNKIKKSIDWSQYFGIDRRRKKTELLARPGTEEQDDEWLLQQYYKTMAENLSKNHYSMLSDINNNRNGSGEKRDKLEQVDEKLKNAMNLIMKDAAKYSLSDNDSETNSQEVKDTVMARLAATYLLEKMRRALNDFKNTIASDRPTAESQNSAKYKNNNTNNKAMNQEKRMNINNNGMKNSASGYYYDDNQDFESYSECPELSRIETSCKPVQRHADYSLFIPCVMYKICRLCNDKQVCVSELLLKATYICDNNNFNGVNAVTHQKQCLQVAMMILQMQLPRIVTERPICYDGTLVNSCLRRYQKSNRSMRHQNINDIVNEDLDPSPEQRWI